MAQQHTNLHLPLFILVAVSCTAFVSVNMKQTNSFLRFSHSRGSRSIYIEKSYAATTAELKPIQAASKLPTIIVKSPSVNVGDASWPPLDSLIGDLKTNITGDVQFLLDFAIIGHPKTATTSTMRWLNTHDEIATFNREIYAMKNGHPAQLVSTLYHLKSGRYYKRGYKAPQDIRNPKALNAFAQYFPTTKLVVGLRHPVRWFESFYNYRASQGVKLPPAEILIGANQRGWYDVCTDGARFHLHLDNLGKTPRSAKERRLLSWRPNEKPIIPNIPNAIFIYEMDQLHDENKTRSDQYLEDLQQFLGLQNALTPIVRGNHVRESKLKAMNICDETYSGLREELTKVAREASTWILEYFLESQDVHVSSPEHFRGLVQSWSIDPCSLK